jgi:ferric-dicitrate binding protein FerR (iron transport regulator)
MDYLDQIDQLTGLEIAGIISDEDRERLHQAIADNPKAFAIWKNKHDFHESEQVHQWHQEFDRNEAYNNTFTRIQGRRRIYKLRLAGGVVAAAVLACSIIYIIRGPEQDEVVAVTEKPTNRIELIISNGAKIDLTGTQGNVPVGDVTLNNSNKILRYSNTGSEKDHASLATLKVPPGKDYKIELSDGSEIWLNSATALTFPFSFTDSTRDILIAGEAYIKIAPNINKPFLVHLPNSTVQILGTEFNVNTYTAGIEKVSLVKGSVKIRKAGKATQLKPGYESVADGDNIQIRPFYSDDVLSWRQGVYNFDNTTLKEICQVMPRWFGVEVMLDNQKIAQKRFTGRIDRNQPIEKSLQLLKAFNDIDYYFDKDGILHIH